ncbi:MAG: S9 family peptidase [Planctomycetaceae bacterium]|nr:S9 family peptidase [Planctomycetaceae bacterium]
MRLALLVLLVSFAAPSFAEDAKLKYPDTRRVDQIDDFHGVKVADPYRWLEDDARTSQEVAEWITAENKVTRAYLDAIPELPVIRKTLADMWNFERYSAPWQEGGRYFYSKNDGLQNQSVLYVADNYAGDGRVLIDPNKWSADGTVALGQTAVSDDGRLLAYTRQEAGSDWSNIHVIEVETGRELPDVLKWARHGNIVWNAAGDGFYYARYPEPPAGEKFQALSLNQSIHFHKLGEPQSADVLIYNNSENPTWSFWIARTEDDKYLILSIARSTDPQNQVLIRPVAAAADAPWTTLIGDFENEFGFIGNLGDKIYFMTDLDAATKRVVAMDVTKPGRDHLEQIVGPVKATLENVSLIDGKLILQYLEDVAARVELFTPTGDPLGDVTLPGIGTASGFGGDQDDKETFYTFTSYTTPPSVYRYDLTAGKSELIRAPKVAFKPEEYESRQVFATSKDGTKVPIIIAHRKGLKLDGENPTLLYAYGGFSISITPMFSVEYAAWMDMGGVVAIANLRGGGEYGEEWHQAGKQLNKQNVFDDFIAAAEWLIAEKYTSSPKLAIMGGSNGGLLVGAVETQRPDLFGACLPAVGVMDMLRYDQFTAGHFWRDEFGVSTDPEQFKALYAYSPYHNIKPGTKYPATLITTADTDDRVVPMHSFKYAAALQAAQAGDAPILIRIETRAGHGAGTPITKRIDQAADKWAFLWKALGMSK